MAYKKHEVVRTSKWAIISLALLVNFPVMAENIDSTVEPDPPAALDSITVTVESQKIMQSLQDTKESVAIFTEEDIEQRGLTSLKDIYEQTPGISGDRFGFRVRGISGGSTGVSRAGLSSVYVDGVGLSGWVKHEGPSQLWDVKQVEVLRGPQSTNLGRNALAGAIVVTTNDPEYDNLAIVRLGIGEYGRQEFKGVANINLVDGVSALRLSVEDSEIDGYIDNLTLDSDDSEFRDNRTIRLKWLLEPTDKLRMVLSLQDLKNDYGDARVLIEGAGFDKKDRISTSDVDSSFALDAFLASLTLDFEINDKWHFKSITASQNGKRDRLSDFDLGPRNVTNGGGVVERDAKDKNVTQEFRFNFETASVRGSTGFYFEKSKSENNNNTDTALDLEVLINDFSPGLGTTLVGLGIYPASYDLKRGGFNIIETQTYALFSEWEIDVSNKWSISFGGRYNKEDQDIKRQNLGSSSITLPTVPSGFGAVIDGAIALVNAELQPLSSDGALGVASTSFTTFLPQVGVTYNWNNDLSMSLFAKRGYRSGGTEVTGLNNINSFDPEYLDNYELALRSLIFDGRGSFNVNAYYGKWKDQQVDVPELAGSSFLFHIQNAGESKIYGVETAFDFDLTHTLSVYAGAAWAKTKYKKFVTSNDDFSGNEFKLAPEVTAAFGVNYLKHNGLFMNANLTYESSSFADDANTTKLEARTLFNLRAGYEQERFKAEIFVNNVFDREYTTLEFGLKDANGNSRSGRVGPPRQIGANLTLFF